MTKKENACNLPKKLLEECLKKHKNENHKYCDFYIKNLITCYERPKKYFYYG
jgi:hypothetical protein